MEQIPRIKDIKAIGRAELLVTFETRVEKIYDCQPFFPRPQFHLLMTPAFFKAVSADSGPEVMEFPGVMILT